MRIAILGRTRMLYDCIDLLIENGHQIVVIGTCKAADEYDIRETDFEKKAGKLGVPFFNDININSSQNVDLLKFVNADVAISVNWITIIGEEVTNCFKYGILNAHCGNLPRYRGNATPNWAILMGEKEYCITIHYMIPGELDSGNILIKERFPITDDTYIGDIYNNLQSITPSLFCQAIKKIEDGDCEGEEQSKDKEDSLRCFPRIPRDSFIDWNNSSEQILRNIRASSRPFAGAYFYYEQNKIFIFKARKKGFDSPCHVYPGQVIKVDKNKGEVEIATSDGVIIFDEIWIDGEKYKASEILNSIRIRLNYCNPDEIYKLRKEIEELKAIISDIKR